jgi:hypothetical protein
VGALGKFPNNISISNYNFTNNKKRSCTPYYHLVVLYIVKDLSKKLTTRKQHKLATLRLCLVGGEFFLLHL